MPRGIAVISEESELWDSRHQPPPFSIAKADISDLQDRKQKSSINGESLQIG
jgi:hypothetical protein